MILATKSLAWAMTGVTFVAVLPEGLVIESHYALAILGGAGAVIAFLFRLLISAKDRERDLVMAEKDKVIADLAGIKKCYQEITNEALKSALDTINHYRQKEGKPPLVPLAPVVSESHSESTAAQREAAAIQTLRATMAMIKLKSGQDPRPEPDKKIEFK